MRWSEYKDGNGIDINQAAKNNGIKYTTAKTILKIYCTEGRFNKMRSRSRKNEKLTTKIESSNTESVENDYPIKEKSTKEIGRAHV